MIDSMCPIKIEHSDLPLACPLPTQALWNQHPRIYLPIEKSRQVLCPYCGTEYCLVSSKDES